ncbi:PQQ-dependent sugar dehydrogenase [soil metagenome]
MLRPILAFSLVITLVLAACGGDGPSPSDPESTAPVATPSTSPSAALSPVPSDPGATPGPSPSGLGTIGDPPMLALEQVADGLDGPLDVATRPSDPATLFVVEQVGRVRLVRDGALVTDALLDIADAVTAGGEQGLLGLAFHPETTDGRAFVYYTARDGSQVVASFRTDAANPDRAVRDSERVLLRMPDEYGNHNGGSMVFGPDGYLYIGTGDGGGGGDPLGSGRSLGTLLAKVLRIDVNVPTDVDPPYAIPADNPFVGRDGARPEIWHTGLRNPWRMQFDQATGDLWIGDVGQGALEEINRAPAGVGGLDFGWNTMEGTRCFRADSCDQAGLTLPVTEYGHDQGCSVTGGTVYRGSAQPALWGWYVFADYCSGRFWVVDAGVDGLQEPVAVLDSGRNISSIAPGPDGELYATDLAGSVHRVVVAGS